MSDRTAQLSVEDLLDIALAAARFPRTVGREASFEPADLDRIATRFPGFLAARLDAFGGGGGAAPAHAGFDAALSRWAAGRARQGPCGSSALDDLARRAGLPLTAGALIAAALPALAEMRRRSLPDRAALEATEPGRGPFSRLFRLLLLGIRLRRPDMLEVIDASPAAVLDWVIVFGLAEHRVWHLLPPHDRRLLLSGTTEAQPLFLRAVLRFRADLRPLAERPLALREWLRGYGAAEYGIRLREPDPVGMVPGLLTVIGPWKQVLGIADDCFSACRALMALDHPFEVVGTRPARWIEVDSDKLALLRGRASSLPHGERAFFCDTLFEAVFWALRHWPRFTAFRRVDLFAPWELPGLPPGWQVATRLFDTIMAPSAYSQQALLEPGGRSRVLRVTSSVEVVGMPRPAAALLLRRILPLPASRRVFVTIFDFSSHLARKNPEAVLRAFARLRRQVPRALLVVKTTRGRRSRGDARRLRAVLRRSREVLWVDGAWSNAALEALLLRADALVSLHRAEGFGRNIAKALLLGRPVVVTDWSGNADMRGERGYCGVPVRLRRTSDRDYVLGDGQYWAEPDPRVAVRQMRAALALRHRVTHGRAAQRFSRGRLAHRLGRVLELDRPT